MRLARLTLAGVLLAGCAAPSARPRQVERRAGRSGLINPLLDSEPAEDYAEFRPFKDKLTALTKRLRAAGKVDTIAIYYRDLNNGPVFGLNDERRYAPASLMKVPLMFVILKQAQEDAGLLERRITYPDAPGVPKYPSETSLIAGRDYSVNELLRTMIVKSDNGAAYLLSRIRDPGELAKVFYDLGLSMPDIQNTADTMRVRDFGAFFRILYNASYLDRRMSERALEYLAASEFKEGLVAGARPGLVIAHKFGERVLPGGVAELNDCGIIYAPEAPYILCLMTRGRNLDDLARAIQDVTRTVDSQIHASFAARSAVPAKP